jgi:hypothetical protein
MGSKYIGPSLCYFGRVWLVAYYDSIMQLLFITRSWLGNIEEALVVSNVAEENSVYTREIQ